LVYEWEVMRRHTAFFALAEELDIPVGIHMGEGPASEVT
jgi:hypothetical protein